MLISKILELKNPSSFLDLYAIKMCRVEKPCSAVCSPLLDEDLCKCFKGSSLPYILHTCIIIHKLSKNLLVLLPLFAYCTDVSFPLLQLHVLSAYSCSTLPNVSNSSSYSSPPERAPLERKRRSWTSKDKPYMCQISTCHKSYYYLHDLRRHHKQKHWAVPWAVQCRPGFTLDGKGFTFDTLSGGTKYPESHELTSIHDFYHNSDHGTDSRGPLDLRLQGQKSGMTADFRDHPLTDAIGDAYPSDYTDYQGSNDCDSVIMPNGAEEEYRAIREGGMQSMKMKGNPGNLGANSREDIDSSESEDD